MAENTNVVDDTYPVHVEIVYPQRSSRLQALLALAFFPKLPVAFLLILITGKHPAILFDFQVGVLRWNTRITAWFICLVDKYPPFRIYS